MLIHADGSVTSYAHCRALYVFAGQQVTRGQVVGEVGTTGLAHGPHLHFEVRRDGRVRNPMRYLPTAAERDRVADDAAHDAEPGPPPELDAEEPEPEMERTREHGIRAALPTS
jgi:hypothetical protein